MQTLKVYFMLCMCTFIAEEYFGTGMLQQVHTAMSVCDLLNPNLVCTCPGRFVSRTFPRTGRFISRGFVSGTFHFVTVLVQHRTVPTAEF